MPAPNRALCVLAKTGHFSRPTSLGGLQCRDLNDWQGNEAQRGGLEKLAR